MSERFFDAPDPADEDPVVHRYLASLARPGPAPGLEHRVLPYVRLPLPGWARRAEGAWRSFIRSGRGWTVLGALAAGSLIPLLALAGATVWFGNLLLAVGTQVVSQAWPAVWAVTVAQVAALSATIPPVTTLLAWTAALLAVCIVCGLALARVARAPRRDGSHVAH